MALKYNSPPNWPAPPVGWAPPPGWQPDAAWGPAPAGWQFWAPETASRQKTNGRTLKIVGSVVAVLFVIGIVGAIADAGDDQKGRTTAGGSSASSATPTESSSADASSASPSDAATAPEETPEPAETKQVEEAPDYTTSQENAIASASDYLDYTAFSRRGLIDQLSSKYGDGFPKADAIFGVNHIKVNWNEQAAKSAKGYLEYTSFSRSGLIEQLESKSGDGFTHAQAVYGVNKTGL